MLDYKNYRPEQFATDPTFRSWKLEGDEEAGRFWAAWLEQHPEKQKDIEKATLLLDAVIESFDQISEAEMRQELARLADQLEQQPSSTFSSWPTEQPLRWWQRRSYQAAAVLFLGLVGLGGWWLRNHQPASRPLSYQQLVADPKQPLTEYVNAQADAQRLALPDGSTILLQPGSKVSYPTVFSGEKREVYLSGEGFFEVVHNPQQPFLVYANQLVTKVLGTSFTVKTSSEDDQVQVMVKTGRVSVYANTLASGAPASTPPREVVLKPNQKVVYLARENLLAKSLVEAPQLLVAPEARPTFSFKAAPIEQVFEELEKAYGIDIVFDKELMKDCYLTASFTDEPLFEKLDLITRTLSASYQQVDGQIRIDSRGCQ